jgi:hypothetical protein
MRAPRAGVRAFEGSTQCLELDDLGVAELPGNECRAIVPEYHERRGSGEGDDRHQQEHKPAEQRPRPDDHEASAFSLAGT